MKEQKKRQPYNFSPQDWIKLIVSVLVIGGLLFIRIATIINPNFFVRDDSTKIIESIRNNNPPINKLPDTLSLDSYTLEQTGYYSSEDLVFSGRPDLFNEVVVGKLTNTGKTIPAWALHLHFDIYDLEGKKIDGAYCIVWNDTDIESGKTWYFVGFDNLDDCFQTVDDRIKVDISKYVVVYKDYDLKEQ